MRWEAWVLLVIFALSIVATIAKPRSDTKPAVAAGGTAITLLMAYLVVRLGISPGGG